MESTDREWGIFTIGNLFNVERGNAKDIRNNVTNGEIVLVSAIDNNNGFYKTVAARNEKVFENAITVNNNGNGVCLAYYHNYKFVASSDVTVLTPKFEVRLNRYIAYFIITVIRQQKSKYNYGYKMSNQRMEKQTILLPTDADGNPNYIYMEQYTKEIERIKRKAYVEFADSLYDKIGGGVPFDSNLKWEAYLIVDLFNDISRGKRLIKESHISGTIPYVSSSSVNNGVDGFIGNNINVKIFNNCLSLANSGSVGTCFYEPFEFIASDHITHLKNNNYNKYQYLFLATIIGRLSLKYNFNREITDYRISREKIVLPKHNDQVFTEYMQEMIKSKIRFKYKEYLEYVKQNFVL